MNSADTQVVLGGIMLWILVIGVPIFFVILFLLPEDAYGDDDVKGLAQSAGRSARRVHVLVLGDIGRSPRMQYHAMSLAKHGLDVNLIGYQDSELHPDIQSNKSIQIFPIDKPPAVLQSPSRALFVVLAPLKVTFQFFSLWQILGHRTKAARWLLVQNPPSIPVLAVAAVMCWLRKTQLIIDWHNFGYSILALKLGPTHILVRLSQWYERLWSGSAHANFSVSSAMARQMKREFGMQQPIVTLHDRPIGNFKPLSGAERFNFLQKLVITSEHRDQIESGQMRLLVSSTSWTADEDFQLLLEALIGYSTLATSTHPQLPELLVIITGKGPQKESYLRKIEALKAEDKLEMVTIKTAWLSTKDYASILGAADLGISLHTSSSGVDLPMKVVDMFGAGLPVAGWGMFEAWPELVQDGVNGRGFGSVEELKQLLVSLLGPDTSRLDKLKEGAMQEGERSWDLEWDRVAAPVFGLGMTEFTRAP